MRVSIQGVQEAQRKNEHIIVALKPAGAFGRAIQFALIQAHRHTVSITHVDTGALRASHRMKFHGLSGQIYIDPAASGGRRTRGGKAARPSVYGIVEHRRGGKHAFYQRTQIEAGPSIARAAADGLIRGLP
jgi:hypothetical protein